MKKFCKSLREHAMKIINLKQQRIKSLTNVSQELYENAKICYICKEMLEDKYAKDKNYCKIRDHCHYTSEYRDHAHSIYDLEYCIPEEVAMIFHNGFNDVYHFIIEELAEEFEGPLTCLGENTEKYITLSVPIEKEVKRIGIIREGFTKTIS